MKTSRRTFLRATAGACALPAAGDCLAAVEPTSRLDERFREAVDRLAAVLLEMHPETFISQKSMFTSLSGGAWGLILRGDPVPGASARSGLEVV